MLFAFYGKTKESGNLANLEIAALFYLVVLISEDNFYV